MKNTRLITLAILGLMTINVQAGEGDPQLLAPTYSLTSPSNFNVMSGDIQITLKDLAIGGSMGLSHSISTFNGSFIGSDRSMSGPSDSYGGQIMTEQKVIGLSKINLITVSDGGASQTFDAGTDVSKPTSDANGYFKPTDDPRYSLQAVQGVGLIFTKPDGTQSIFPVTVPFAGNPDWVTLSEIRYPNGFNIKINQYANGHPASVKTNTGFQLRYYNHTDGNTSPYGFIYNNYVVGINNAVQYCPHTLGTSLQDASCPINSPTKWPRAHYIWPNNMPNDAFNNGFTFRAVKADGSYIDYRHAPGKNFSCDTSGCILPSPIPARIVGIRPSSATSEVYNYSYQHRNNYPNWATVDVPYTASHNGTSEQFQVNQDWSYPGGAVKNAAYIDNNYHNMTAYKSVGSLYPGYNLIVDTWDAYVTFANNRPQQVTTKKTGVTSTYGYDTRGNITSITQGNLSQTAKYEDACNSSNFKYCNSPQWVKDSNGNTTFYSYHAPSGQVATVTYPADKRGISAVKRYTYELKYARFYQDGNPSVKSFSPLGIWMKTKEKTCLNGATQGDACALSNDELVTTYEYNDNLLLSGVVVTDPVTGKVRRTCYQYDAYGNRIGEIQPNAQLGACSI